MSDRHVQPGDEGKNTMSSQILLRLRERIVSGDLAAGSKINLDQVRAGLQVSLSPLREALARLTADGLVLFEDNRGYRVAPVSATDFEEIVLLRDRFETHALRESMANGDLSWEGEVIRALHRLNRSERDANCPDTLALWEAAHREFHLALIAGCGMPVLLRFCATLLTLHDRYRRTFLRRTSGDRNVVLEHSEIAQAAVARDADYACDRLRDHLARTSGNLRDYLRQGGPGK
ncbi:GntR family transcriptional regulator [Paracoccus sediminis]|uniref:DNA-binding transcriptional regulator, GntR family n=1 Tax=Paracoccus sediminis TaxID=1214787 RepID=A0A238UW89_9RHOB|nr:GntR family transcriptional regulator [Paracoccus sediminis]TBN52736.1 GntR family transcriptional regulator [Paracoccus sediminis]SNR26276.1 DNA-binding transcriptional regulator, GntR family [Paracoccus sediminis]